MSDIFISYARSTEREAHKIAEALRAQGYSVWRDDELPSHRPYADEIKERLKAAKAVVVIWSADAVKSEWVQSEADRARADRKLVQLSLDGAELPMPFDRIQCADLAGWRGDLDAAGWRKVVDSVAALTADRGLPASALKSAPAAPAAEPLLAVLAFDNLSGDTETTYFSDGVSEEIQETIARGAELKVIGRGSSFQFRGPDKAARRVAAELNVTHVLDGSVRRAGSRVRVAAQLVECAGQTTLWSSRFDRELTDIFALQDEIASAVAAALKATFAESKLSGPIDPSVYDLYLQARASFDTFRAIGMLETVVSRAPGFARAWAELALRRVEAYRSRRVATVRSSDAAAAAERAVALDPSLGVVHMALSELQPLGNYQARETLLEKALAASPDDPRVLGAMSLFYNDVGRLLATLDCARRGLALDPNTYVSANRYAGALDQLGRWDEARPLWEECLVRWPEARAGITLNILIAAGESRDWARFDACLAATPESILTENPDIQATVPFHRNLRRLHPRYVPVFLDYAKQAIARTGACPLNVVAAAYELGLKDEAYQFVDQSSYNFLFDPDGPPPGELHYRTILFRRRNKLLVDDPRFPTLAAKLGLCAYWIATDRWPDCADEVPYDFRAAVKRAAQSPLEYTT